MTLGKLTDDEKFKQFGQAVVTLPPGSTAKVVQMHSGSKYRRAIHSFEGDTRTVDVYHVIDAFGVTCPAVAHALKKLLCSGLRGKADRRQDLSESIDAITRAIELHDGRTKAIEAQEALEASEVKSDG